jgi:hypothetical protein
MAMARETEATIRMMEKKRLNQPPDAEIFYHHMRKAGHPVL